MQLNTFMLVDIVLIVGLYAIYFIASLRKQRVSQIILRTVFWGYVAALVLMTVSPMQMVASGVDFSLSKMNLYAFQYNLDNEIIGNILLFVPFGFLLPLAYPKVKDLTILFAILTSLLVEFSQQSIGRVSDLTDIVNNSLGAIVGFYCFVAVAPLIRLATKPKVRLRRKRSGKEELPVESEG